VLGGIGCDQEWTESTVPASVLNWLDDKNRVTDFDGGKKINPVFQLTLPDSLSELFQLRTPALLTAEGAPADRFAVWDRADRAIHVFGTEGNHIQTVFGNGRNGSPKLDAVTSMDMTEVGEIVAVTADGTVYLFDSEGSLRGTKRIGVAGENPVLGSISAGPAGTLFQHWFFRHPFPARSKSHIAGGPLIRVWDKEGRLISQLGRAEEWPGRLLTYRLNRGIIALQHDTLWFARRADARVFGFRAGGDLVEVPPDTISLPVFFEAKLPKEFVSSSGGATMRLQEHLGDFAVDRVGRFYFVQHVAWPDPEGGMAPLNPDSRIVVVERQGSLSGIFTSLGLPQKIAVVDSLILVSEVDGMGIWAVRAYANPLDGP
jgi:hypothetical protein